MSSDRALTELALMAFANVRPVQGRCAGAEPPLLGRPFQRVEAPKTIADEVPTGERRLTRFSFEILKS